MLLAKPHCIRIFVATLLCFSFATSLMANASDTPLVNSGGELETAEGQPQGWKTTWSSRGDFSCTVDKATKYQGEASIRMTNRPNGAKYPRLLQAVKLEGGAEYILSAWVLIPSARANLQVTPADKTWFGINDYGPAVTIKDSDQWQLVSKRFTTTEAVTVNVVLTLETPDREAAEMWVDDVHLTTDTADSTMAIRSTTQSATQSITQDLNPFIPEPDASVVLPHVDWARSLPGDRRRVLFVAPQITIRDVIELAHRMDVTAGFQYAPTEKSAMTSEFLEELRKPWHAIVLGSVNWDWFEPAVKDALWNKVRSGTGLVMIQPEGDDSTLEQVLKAVRPAGNRAFFTEQQVVGFPLLPWLQNAELSTGQLDNGRIAVMDYRLDGHDNWGRTVSSLFPPHKEHAPRHDDMPWWEPYYALLTRAVLSTVHEPAIEISGIRSERTDRDVVTFIVDLDGEITGSHVHATCIGPGNRSVVEVDAPVNAETGTATVTLRAPFMTGAHFVWLWVRGADGRDLQWGAYLFDVPGITAAIATDSVRYERGNRVRGRVDLSGVPPTGAHVEVSLIDTFGRVVDQVRVDTADQESFSLKSEGVYSRTARVVARLVSDREQGSRVECEDSRTVAIADEIDDSDYVVGIWASYYNQVFQLPWAHHMLTLQHEMGIDFAYMAHATAENYYQAYAEHNMWPVPEEMHRIWFKERDPYLTLDLNDPSFQSKYSQSIDKAARDGYRWGAYDFSVGDECGYALRYNETTFAAFREWLKPRYETLEHLNRVWGTQYAAWEEVEPKRLQEIESGTGVAPHLEFCTFSDELFAEAFQNAGDIVRAIDSRNRIGLTGTRDPGYYIGYDWHRLMQSITHLAFYDGIQREIIRSFKKPGDLITSFVGFDFYDLDERNARYFPWLELYNGFQGISIYSASSKDWHGYIRHDLSWTRRAEWLMEELGELKTGVGRAILTADRDPAQIAVLHSQRSLHVVGSAHWRDNTTAVCETLKDLGLQFDFVADQDLPSGALSEQPYKVLFLPMAVALSNDEASAIEAFAQNGGRVIAVGDVGVYDRFGALRSKGALDDLFGISRTSQPYAGTQDSAQASMNLYGVDLDVPPAGVLLNQGQGTFEGLDVRPLSSRAVGEGQAIFLNFLWSPYRSFRSGGIGGEIVYRHSSDAATARAFWRIMEELLEGTGIERPVRVLRDGQPAHNIEQVVYRRGAITYLGLLPRYYGGRYTKETERNLIKDEDYVDVELILGNASDYVYDVRQRKSLGQIQSLNTKVTNGVALLYALTPYAIEGLELSAPSSAQPGDTLDISAHVAADTENALGDHVVHIKLVMPDGKVADWASHNLLTQRGTGRWQPQLALNALPGIWRVEAQELVSGKTAFKEIVVHPE